MIDYLDNLGIIDRTQVSEYYPRVRDRDDIKVMRCNKSGVIFLNKIDLPDYTTADPHPGTFSSGKNRADIWVEFLSEYLEGKNYADIGAGSGDTILGVAHIANRAVAVEAKAKLRAHIMAKLRPNVAVCEHSSDLKDFDYHVITMIHLLEHLEQPVEELKLLKTKLVPGGHLFVEVPHARDFLFNRLDIEEFKAFTFWSEHLMLHTKDSLRIMFEAAGFTNIDIRGAQRYPLANHLYWLRYGKPGGQKHWDDLNSDKLAQIYELHLDTIDQTDTLVAWGINDG